MQRHDLSLIFLAFASEFLGTLSGFGSSTFFVPAALLFEPAQFVLAITGLLHCFGNLSKIALFHRHFDWRLFFTLAIPSVLCTALGALLVVHLGTGKLRPALGLFLAVYGVYSLLGPKRVSRFPRWAVAALSAISGLATGFIGTGGAIRGIALHALQMPKASFVMMSASVDLGGDVLRTAIYLRNGFMSWDQWFYLPLLAIAAFGGAKLGKALLHRMDQQVFERIVAGFILLSGTLMLV